MLEMLVLKFWKDNKCFEKSNELSKDRERFTFIDGPPFATGLPHFGHILTGTVKDIVTRYQYQHGKHVDRRFGWDCHGLPVEFEIDKRLGIKLKSQIVEMGIDKYNAECRSIVMKYSSEWKDTVERMGRWVDFDNSYKTMSLEYMNSVWYIFSQLYKKELVYRGYRVMPFSTGCMTTLSNSEAKYKIKSIFVPSVVVAFPLKTQLFDKDVALLAWTTTPWTLPSNCGLVINPELEYQIFEMNDKFYAMLPNRIEEFFKEGITLHEKIKGDKLVNLQYEQPFDYFEKHRANGFFKVLVGSFVSADEGTGIVHAAPAFGEQDYNCFVENKIIKQNGEVPCPVDENGKFTEEVTDFKGMYFKHADKHIIKFLKDKIFKFDSIVREAPYCWRSETPLINKLVPSWFIRVSDSIEKLLKTNQKINWVPEDIKDNKFGQWLENAKDWSVSRSRFWGNPIPLWVSDDYTEILCIESAEQLSKLSGREITDLHMEFIDDIVLEQNGKKLKRIPEVLDCWFESGSALYAQRNWPHKKEDSINCESTNEGFKKDGNFIIYENKKLDNFPADFVAEGIDQTRGWFYSQHTISTLLFDEPAFKNAIVNGIVLAENGKKMSKKDKNYPDPKILMEAHGADSLRMYLVSSPVVEAESLPFKENGPKEWRQSLIIPWMSVLKFYSESAPEQENAEELELDSWILYTFNEFVSQVSHNMDKYELAKVCPLATKFIDDLSNWYLKVHRVEIRSGNSKVLAKILKEFSIVMASFAPFHSEYCYQCVLDIKNRNNGEIDKELRSVHFEMFPEIKKCESTGFDQLRIIIDTMRYLRDKHNITLKTPLREVTIISDENFETEVKKYSKTISRECNILSLVFKRESDLKDLKVEYKVKPCFEFLKKDQKTMKDKMKIISKLTQAEARELLRLKPEEELFNVKRENVLIEKKATYPTGLCMACNDFVILVDDSVDEEVLEKKTAREFNSFLHKLRKACGFKMEDLVNVEIDNEYVRKAASKHHSITFSSEGKIVEVGEADAKKDIFTYEGKEYKVVLRTQ